MVNEISSTKSSSDDRTAATAGVEEYAFQASFGQERLWVLEHLRADVPLYMHSFAVRCRGPLDVRALRSAVTQVVARHETLRTRFEIRDGVLVQVVVASLEVDVPVVDLTHLPQPDAEAEARRLAESLDDEPVDLATPPLVRFRLLRVAGDDHVLVVAIHHIVSDGWSIGILMRELGHCYDAALDGVSPGLPELPIQYADYAAWQREWLSGAELDKQVAYWSDALAGAPALLGLPTDRPRPPVQRFDGATRPIAIPAEVVARLNDLAADVDATPFMALTAAVAAVLHRHASQTDLLLATPVAGRRRSEVEGLIGFFVNTLVLRTDCSGNPAFRELLGRVRRTALEAYAHQDLPFEKLVEELNPERDLSHLPLAQVMLVLQTVPENPLELRDVEVTPYALAEDMAPYDITIELSPAGDALEGSFLYNTDLFEASTIDGLIAHVERFLAHVARDPDARIDQVALLERDETDRLVHGWVDVRPELRGPPLLHERLERQALETPDRVALDCPGRAVTYAELDHMAKALATRLRGAGLGREDRIGVYFDKSAEMIVALCGILRSGAAFVPLDPDGPAERLRLILEDLRPALLLTGGREHERVSRAVAELDQRPSVWTIAAEDLAAAPADGAAPAVRSNDLAYVIYTSGSTGVPKGVMIEQSGVVGMVQSMAERYDVTKDTRFLQFMSIGFDASFSEIFPTLLVGGTLVVRDRADLMPGPGLIDLLGRDQVTHVLTTPSALGVMRPAELPHLRTLIVCGEACSADLVARWANGRRFVNAYGPTEVTVCTHTCHVVEEGKPPIGYGLANTESYVLDRSLNEVPPGVKGELHIGSPGVARGYLGRPDLTAAAFVPNPFGPPGSRMYKTGDVVRLRRDGQVDFLGRVDDQAKVRGFRIEPGEIEAALALHPEVDDAAVVTDRDAAGATRLVCYFTSAAGADAGALRDFLAARLPSYMIPAGFLRLDAMPRSSAGKLDRNALPDPRSVATDTAASYVPPATATEKETARVWAEVLGLERVGVRDKFFEVGGNSLKIVELFERLDDLYPGALTVAELFEHATVTAMAAAIDARATTDDPASALAGFEL
ncbi:MAG TPA: amino acid adenylation domain-containing protein [Actinomycetota bacterium]|nr:amino acid adenylation domain-containing protein [Actinomycetota bacterium]